jgi:hypothetical protein
VPSIIDAKFQAGQNAKSLSNAQLCQTSSPKNRPLDSTKSHKKGAASMHPRRGC